MSGFEIVIGKEKENQILSVDVTLIEQEHILWIEIEIEKMMITNVHGSVIEIGKRTTIWTGMVIEIWTKIKIMTLTKNWIRCNSQDNNMGERAVGAIHSEKRGASKGGLTIVGEKVEEKQQLVSDLQKKSQKKDIIVSFPTLQLRACFIRAQDFAERLKSSEQELQLIWVRMLVQEMDRLMAMD
ncbi:hypothetical protein B296_00000558, partial [Ensete ventricosum]